MTTENKNTPLFTAAAQWWLDASLEMPPMDDAAKLRMGGQGTLMKMGYSFVEDHARTKDSTAYFLRTFVKTIWKEADKKLANHVAVSHDSSPGWILSKAIYYSQLPGKFPHFTTMKIDVKTGEIWVSLYKSDTFEKIYPE